MNRLKILATRGDGSCLIHSLMLCICGEEDSDHALRGLLVDFLSEDNVDISRLLFERYVCEEKEQLSRNKIEDCQSNDDHYKNYLREVSDAGLTRALGGNYEFLSGFHIFCMSNMLRRPIVVHGLQKLSVYSLRCSLSLKSIKIFDHNFVNLSSLGWTWYFYPYY